MTQQHHFQADIAPLLHLMTHSLYGDKKVFLRELVSNAADAIEKLRFEATQNSQLFEDQTDLSITITFNPDDKTLTLSDTGIGMTEAEATAQLGSIAHSGTRAFLEKAASASKDHALIGQFGVGFYAAFMVADRVVVETRKAGTPDTEGVRWTSAGQATFETETIQKKTRGTSVILYLKEEEAKTFLDPLTLRNIVREYSDHLPIPIRMAVLEQGKPTDNFETINRAQALWQQSPKSIEAKEYQEFYHHIQRSDMGEPLSWIHTKVEGKYEFTLLLYLPKAAPWDLYHRDIMKGLKLYVQRVFIMDQADVFLPHYLRFVKGMVDCSDLPLNVSREILQNNKVVEVIKNTIKNKVLSLLEDMAETKPEDFSTFINALGSVLKEGPAEDPENKERILKLLRFHSIQGNEERNMISLDDYIARMPLGQEKIYYLAGEHRELLKKSPHLEILKKKNIEVLLLDDRVDEWLTAHVHEYQQKPWQSIARGDLDVKNLGQEETPPEELSSNDEKNSFLQKLKNVLADRVSEVRFSQRLTESPCCVVASEQTLTPQLKKWFESMGQSVPETKPIFEINPHHPVIKRLEANTDQERLSTTASLLLDAACLADGQSLEKPADFVKTLYTLLEA